MDHKPSSFLQGIPSFVAAAVATPAPAELLCLLVSSLAPGNCAGPGGKYPNPNPNPSPTSGGGGANGLKAGDGQRLLPQTDFYVDNNKVIMNERMNQLQNNKIALLLLLNTPYRHAYQNVYGVYD